MPTSTPTVSIWLGQTSPKARGTPYQMVAGNFRGARVGLFSYNTEADEGIADFDYFKYQVNNR